MVDVIQLAIGIIVGVIGYGGAPATIVIKLPGGISIKISGVVASVVVTTILELMIFKILNF